MQASGQTQDTESLHTALVPAYQPDRHQYRNNVGHERVRRHGFRRTGSTTHTPASTVHGGRQVQRRSSGIKIPQRQDATRHAGSRRHYSVLHTEIDVYPRVDDRQR